MGLFARRKPTSPEPLAAPQVDDGVWRRTLRNADSRASIKRAKLHEAVAEARREAAALISAGRPSVAGQRVSTALGAQRDIAALDAVSRAATALLAIVPNISAAPPLASLTAAAREPASTLLAAGDPPPIVPEAAHIAGQLNAFYTASAVAAFRATVDPDEAVVAARNTQSTPTPQEVSEAMQAVARDYNVVLPADSESVPPAVAKAARTPPTAMATGHPVARPAVHASAWQAPAERAPPRPLIKRVVGRPPLESRTGAPLVPRTHAMEQPADLYNSSAADHHVGTHALEQSSQLYKSGSADYMLAQTRATPPHLRSVEPTSPVLAATARMATQRRPVNLYGSHTESAQSTTAWMSRDSDSGNRKAVSYKSQDGGPNSPKTATNDLLSSRERRDQPVEESNTLFIDDDEMLLVRYQELMSV